MIACLDDLERATSCPSIIITGLAFSAGIVLIGAVALARTNPTMQAISAEPVGQGWRKVWI